MPRSSTISAIVAIVLFAAGLHAMLVPRVSDADSFYHLRHAWVYRVHGIFDSSFPWAQFSIVKTHAADIWYGFHLLGIPLTLFEPLTHGLYFGAWFVTVITLCLVWSAFRRLAVPFPLAWVFFFALINADVLYRLTMLRPHPLSLGLSLVLFAQLVRPIGRYGNVPLFAIAALFAWNHIVVFWLALLVAGAVTMVRLLHRQAPEWAKLAALTSGLAVGALLRPNPLGALRITYDVLAMMLVDRERVPLNIGKELYPFGWEQFIALFLPFSAFLLAGLAVIVILIWQGRFKDLDRDQKITLWSSLLLTIIFGAMTFLVARRSHELFIAFGTILLALLQPHAMALVPATWRPRPAASANRADAPTGSLSWFNRLAPQVKLVVFAATGAMLLTAGWHLREFHRNIENLFHPIKFEGVGKWLSENAEPGAIVFHPDWDRFGELFFWNPNAHYINGMDPILHYRFDERTYWQAFYMAIDRATEVTCSSYPCQPHAVVRTYDSLKHDFGASWVVVEMNRTPKLYETLRDSPGFTRILETDGKVALFRID